MDYVVIEIKCEADIREILGAELWQLGYESFLETSDGLQAFIPSNKYHAPSFKELMTHHHDLSYTMETLAPQNWNRQWEEKFDPLTVDKTVRVRASFHAPDPQYSYEIVIDPKMSFGTGHHETTRLMMRNLISMSVEGKSTLDVGCGTGILGILAEKLGANHILGIDNDSHAVRNAEENIHLNGCRKIKIVPGTIKKLPSSKFHLILANINRNVLLDEMPIYSKFLVREGILIVSGFYTEDQPHIVNKGEALHLKLKAVSTETKWACLVFNKVIE